MVHMILRFFIEAHFWRPPAIIKQTANRWKNPGTRKVCHELEEPTAKRPSTKSFEDRSRFLLNTALLVYPFLTIGFIEKVQLKSFEIAFAELYHPRDMTNQYNLYYVSHMFQIIWSISYDPNDMKHMVWLKLTV